MTLSSLLERLLVRVRPQSQLQGQSQQGVPVSPRVLAGWYARKGAIPLVRGTLRGVTFGGRAFPFFLGGGGSIAYARRLFVGRAVLIGAGTRINAFSTEGVHLADGVTIREGAWIQCSSHPGHPGVGLWVGANTYIGPSAIVGVGGPVRIGAHCQIGAGCTFIAENHAEGVDGPSASEVTRQGIEIGAGTWIGHRVTILDGVTLGEKCVVGAGAVVTKSFPAGSKLVGVPARSL